MNFAPSQKAEWVGTTILYRRKITHRWFFGLFRRTSYGGIHHGKVVDVTANAVAFRLAPSFNLFTGMPDDQPNEVWVSLDEIEILNVLPYRHGR